MELLDGATLQQVIDADGPMPVARAGHVLEQVAGALAEAHDLGLIHRDIKPANVMLCNPGGQADDAKVLDFGLVKDIAPASGLQETSPHLTQADSITGTPQYMAPEALTRPGSVDARSDLYALGAVAYYLLTGEHVFVGNTVIEICSLHLHEPPVPPSQRLGSPLPAALESLVLRCLAKSPDQRPPTAHAFLDELTRCELPAWDNASARAWWSSHHPLRSIRPASKVSTSQSILVDLARRSS
jgi:serine/threonine-protein kinase